MSGTREILQARKIFSVSLRGIRKSAGLLISWIDLLIDISVIQTTILRLGSNGPKPHRRASIGGTNVSATATATSCPLRTGRLRSGK